MPEPTPDPAFPAGGSQDSTGGRLDQQPAIRSAQSNGVDPPIPDGCLDQDDPFDPAQWAMHGLLAAHYEDSSLDRERRVQAVLERVKEEASRTKPPTWVPLPVSRRAAFFRRFSPLAHPRRWLLTGLAAAGIIIAFTLFWHSTPKALASDLLADAANAGTAMFFFARDLTGLFGDDPALAGHHRKVIEDETRKRDEALATVARAPELYDALPGEILFAWQALYCTYRELGLREEAIRENEAALAYARHNPTGARSTAAEVVLLDGLGNTLAAFGDYPAARKAYLDSIALHRQSGGETRDPHAGETGYEGHLAIALTIPYLRLVMLGIAENDLDQAGQWQSRAEKSLGDLLRTTCERNGVDLPASRSLWDAWNVLPAEYHHPKMPYSEEETKTWPEAWEFYCPTESYLHLIGAVLYHEAVLQRLRGDYAAARLALDRAATLEDWLTRNPRNDEYHLPLILRIERARVAIIEKDYASALRHLDGAEQYLKSIGEFFAKQAAGEIEGPLAPDVHKLPIGPARLAEMRLLRGLALLGLEEARTCGTGVSPVDAGAGNAGARIPLALDGTQCSQGPRTPTGETPVPQEKGEAPAEPGSGPRPRAAESPAASAPFAPMTPRRAEALELIRKSLAVPEKLAAGLPADQREAFLKQFEPWQRLAESPTRSATSSPAANQERSR